VSTMTSILTVALCSLAAYSFSRFRWKSRKRLLQGLLLSQVFPNILAIVAVFLMLQQIGRIFPAFGLNTLGGLILIYLLVVAHFKSYLVPLIIMAPIPLTLIGVMPGHALLGSQYTATSMIGMIALAGIIVRNSILLVDFIRQQVDQGMPFAEAIVQSAAVRAKPIALTALAAMLGALFILDDPIFNGLAISLIFGILVSTLLTLVVIPVLYYAAFRKDHQT